jgi:hypothetical protein
MGAVLCRERLRRRHPIALQRLAGVDIRGCHPDHRRNFFADRGFKILQRAANFTKVRRRHEDSCDRQRAHLA